MGVGDEALFLRGQVPTLLFTGIKPYTTSVKIDTYFSAKSRIGISVVAKFALLKKGFKGIELVTGDHQLITPYPSPIY